MEAALVVLFPGGAREGGRRLSEGVKLSGGKETATGGGVGGGGGALAGTGVAGAGVGTAVAAFGEREAAPGETLPGAIGRIPKFKEEGPK